MKNKINVIHVFGSLNVGGAESRMMDIYRKIDRNKVNFNFVSLDLSENQYFEEEIKLRGGNINKVNSPREIGVLSHLKELIKIFKVNNDNGKLIIHAHTLHHCGLVMLAAKLSKVKIRISQSRATNTQHTNIKSRIMVFIGKILISVFATEMLAITKESADFLFFKKYIKNKKVKIVPNAIQLDIYKNISNEEIIKLKKQYSITSNNVVIGHVGRFEVMKNHKFLIDLFFDYNKLNPNSILVLIGDGTLKMVMEKLVKDLGLNNNVIFLGIRSDVYLWMNIFDVVLLPSLFEGLPGVASEAQAAGTPCVLSDTITNKSDLGLGLLRYLSITGDKGDWIKAINYYIKTNKPSFSLIENKFDEKNLSLSKGIEVLNKIYKIS